ncbi:MAG: alpha-L-arabinofuranosidase, partial [Prevotella sp.]|nr:alpha-L-arabinofuranosidase [Prevotella sp.]
MNLKLFTFALTFTVSISMQAQHTMDLNTKKLGAPVSPTMYGLFFEDINFAADGGLYGELVKNRSFEFPQAF